MPQIIEVPGMGQVSFPDGMTDADISTAIQRNMPKAGLDFSDPLSPASIKRAAASRAVPESPSMGGSFLRGARENIGAGVGGALAGAASGAGTGAALGAMGLNPLTVGVGTIGGALVGGIGGAFAGGKIQGAIDPITAERQAAMALDQETNPISSFAGQLAPALITGKVSPTAIKSAFTPLSRATTAAQRTATVSSRINMGAEAAIGGGFEVGQALATGQEIDPMRVAMNAGVGALFGTPNRLGRMFYGRQNFPTDSQNGVQGEPATGTPGGGVVPLETNATVGKPNVERGPVIRMGNGEVDPYYQPRVMPMRRALPAPDRFLPGPAQGLPAPRIEDGRGLPIPVEQALLPAPQQGPLALASPPMRRIGTPARVIPQVSELPVVPKAAPETPVVPEIAAVVPQTEMPVQRSAPRERYEEELALEMIPWGTTAELSADAAHNAGNELYTASEKVYSALLTAFGGVKGSAMANGEIPYPSKAEFIKSHEYQIARRAFQLETKIRDQIIRLGFDPDKSDLPLREQFASGRDWYQAMLRADIRMVESGAAMAASSTPRPAPRKKTPTQQPEFAPQAPLPVTPEVAPLKGTVALATGRLNAAKNQLAKLEASGKAPPEQLAKRRAFIATLEQQVEAAGSMPDSRASQLQKRVDDTLESGEFQTINLVRQNGGFAPPDRAAGLIDSNIQRGAKIGEKNRKIADGFGETRDDAVRVTDFPDTPAGELAAGTLRSLHNKSPNALTVDKMAESLGMTVKDFHAKLNAELDSIYRNNGKKAAAQEQIYDRQERQLIDFENAIDGAPAKAKATPDELGLEKGDEFTGAGEPFKVIAVTDETVTLRDGERFGDQTVSNDTPLPVDNLTSPARVRTAEEIAAQKEMDAIANSEAQTRADAEIPADPVTSKAAEDVPPPAKDDFALKAHADDAEIKAEKAQAKQKEELKNRAAARLKGDAGDLTPDIFGEGDTPLFNARRDTPTPQQKSMIDSLKEHQNEVRDWIKGEQRSGRMNSMPVDILGAQAYDAAISLLVRTLEGGAKIGQAVRAVVANIKQQRQLSRDDEASIKAALIAKAQDHQRFAEERDAKFMREMPKLAEEMVAQGKTPTLPDLINGLAARFPDQAAYIRRNGATIHANMMFARDTRLRRTTEAEREWGEWADGAMEGSKKLYNYASDGTGAFADIKRLATSFHATYMTGIGNKMRHLAQGNITGNESVAWGKFTEDLVGLAKGKDGVHRVATDLAMDRDVQIFANHLDSIKRDLGPTLKAMPRGERRAFMERVGDHITDASRDGELASQPVLKKAVDAYIKIREDLLKHMKDSGVEVGDVGSRSMRRILDRSTVLSNEGEFVKQAANAYRAKWRKETAALNREAAGLDPVKDKARLASIKSELAEIAKRDAADSAKKYFTNIQADEVGITSDGNDLFHHNNGNPSSMKSREFGPEADQLLGKFYLRDPDAILRREIADAVRAAGVARTFSGPKLDAKGKPLATGEIDPMAKWKQLRNELIEEGNADMIPMAATLLKEHFNLGGQDNPTMRKALEVAHTHGQLAFLARAVLSSMGEPALAGVRTGKLSDVAKGYVNTVKGMVKELRGLGPDEARILSNAIGASSDGMNAILASSRFLDSYALGGKSGELVANFHAKTWLNALTQSVHAASVDIAHSFIRTQLDLRQAGGKFKTTAGKHLNELGIQTKDIPAMLKFSDDLAKATDKTALLLADTPEAKMYRDALHLFKTSGGSLHATRGNRAQFANSPIGGMFYAFKSFLFAFQDQVLSRHARLMRSAYRGETLVDGAMEKLSTTERAKMVGETLQGVAVIAAAQFAIQMVRETMFSDPARRIDDRKTPADKVRDRAFSVATRSSFFGGYDTVYNMFTGARHGGNPATVLLGPSLGLAADVAAQSVGIVAGDKNSPNTNTAERKLARSMWGLAVQPALNAAFATMPGSAAAATLVQAGAHPGTREIAIRSIAGPPMKQGGPMKKASGF